MANGNVSSGTPAERIYGWIRGNNLKLRGYYDGGKGKPDGEKWYTDEHGGSWSQYDVSFTPDPSCDWTADDIPSAPEATGVPDRIWIVTQSGLPLQRWYYAPLSKPFSSEQQFEYIEKSAHQKEVDQFERQIKTAQELLRIRRDNFENAGVYALEKHRDAPSGSLVSDAVQLLFSLQTAHRGYLSQHERASALAAEVVRLREALRASATIYHNANHAALDPFEACDSEVCAAARDALNSEGKNR